MKHEMRWREELRRVFSSIEIVDMMDPSGGDGGEGMVGEVISKFLQHCTLIPFLFLCCMYFDFLFVFVMHCTLISFLFLCCM